jgi:hypothetical protein
MRYLVPEVVRVAPFQHIQRLLAVVEPQPSATKAQANEQDYRKGNRKAKRFNGGALVRVANPRYHHSKRE